MPKSFAQAITLHDQNIPSYFLGIVDTEKFVRGKCIMPKEVADYEIEERLDKEIFTFPHNYEQLTRVAQHDSFPIELSHILSAIEDAEYLYDLEDNWDSEGALPISQQTFDKAVYFIKSYSVALCNDNKIIVAPVISPLSDGSIDILWQTRSNSLLVNIKNNNQDVAYFYGVCDIDTEKDHFNGKVTTSAVKTFFKNWLESFQMEETADS